MHMIACVYESRAHMRRALPPKPASHASSQHNRSYRSHTACCSPLTSSVCTSMQESARTVCWFALHIRNRMFLAGARFARCARIQLLLHTCNASCCSRSVGGRLAAASCELQPSARLPSSPFPGRAAAEGHARHAQRPVRQPHAERWRHTSATATRHRNTKWTTLTGSILRRFSSNTPTS